MSEISTFINNWGVLLRNLILIAGVFGGLFKLLKTLDRINTNIEEIPDLKSNIESLQKEVKNIFNSQQSMQNETKSIKEDLQKHCKNGMRKDKLTLDMSRQMLLNEIDTAIHMGWASINKKTVLSELYESYRNEGGNGTIQALWATYLALPTEPPETKKVE